MRSTFMCKTDDGTSAHPSFFRDYLNFEWALARYVTVGRIPASYFEEPLQLASRACQRVK